MAKKAAQEAAEDMINRANSLANEEKLPDHITKPDPIFKPPESLHSANNASGPKNASDSDEFNPHRSTSPNLDEFTATESFSASSSMATKAKGKLTPDNSGRLQKEKLAEKIRKLESVELLEKGAYKICGHGAKSSENASTVYLIPCENAGESASESILINLPTSGGDGDPGNGGVSRGRGDANLNFTGKTTEEGYKFKEHLLPQADFDKLKEAKKVGIGISTPETEVGESSTGSALAVSGTTGGGAFTRKIAPKYRGTVKRFFQRK